MVLLYGVESGTVPEKFESGQKPMVIALIIVWCYCYCYCMVLKVGLVCVEFLRNLNLDRDQW